MTKQIKNISGTSAGDNNNDNTTSTHLAFNTSPITFPLYYWRNDLMAKLTKNLRKAVTNKLTQTVSKTLICSAIAQAVLCSSVFAADLFVATTGIDDKSTNDGSILQPWASLAYALEQVAPGDNINIRSGRYYETIRKGSVSGTATQPIIIQAYNGEQVTFDGTTAINGSWTHHAGNIYKLQLAEPIWQLFVDDEMMMNARWPNARFDDGSVYSRDSWALGLDATTTNGYIDTDASVHDLAAANIDASDAVIVANTRHFNSYTRKVTAHSAGSNVIEHGVTPFFWGTKSYYYLQGSLSLLDQNKEWHIDASNNTAYFWAADGNEPSGNIRGRNQQFVIDANNWNYVNFKGLDFFATTIELTASESITIEDCNFNYGGASKRALGEVDAKASLLRLTNTAGAGNFVIRNTTITNSDSQAFYIKGENSIVENSLFENIDWAATESYSVSASLVFMGDNTLFSRNTVRNAGTSETIATGVAVGSSSIVAQYNDIYNTGYAQSDGAQIQIRIDAQDGTIVHHNWLHDTPKYGFRFDAPIPPPSWGKNGFSHHNVVWNSSGANPKGMDDRHYNNLLFDNDKIDLIILDDTAENGDKSNEFTKTINNVSDSISGHRTDVTPVPGIVGTNFNGVNETAEIKTLLRDPQNYDFRPAIGSSLIDAGEVISDVDYSHPTQGGAPDLGAYENGDTNYWIPGRKLANSSHPIPFTDGSTTNVNSDLMWREGYKATAHKIYFGTSSGALDYKGQQSNNIFSPGSLTIGQTYYWRVDAVTPSGIVTGDEWHFTVEAVPTFTTVNPIADSYVDDNKPDDNMGSDSVIKLTTPVTPGGSYEQRFGFLKFDVDVPGTIISAKLKVYNNQTSKNRYVNVHTVADTSWAEDLITWNNQPTMGAALQQLDVLANSWAEFDVLAAITTDVKTAGQLSLGLKRDASDSRRQVVSKEGSFSPELILEYKNFAPVFSTDIISLANALENVAYSASMAIYASDSESDHLTFTKVSGPSWLTLASDGSLYGTPSNADIGENTFIVTVEDGYGGKDTATLTITVNSITVLFSDDMEDGSMSGWSRTNKVSAISPAAYEGSYGARIKNTSSMEQAIDTSGYSDIKVSYQSRTKNFDSGEYFHVEWYDGSSWHTLELTNDTNWTFKQFDLPVEAQDNSAVKIRFSTNADLNNESGDIDNILITANVL